MNKVGERESNTKKWLRLHLTSQVGSKTFFRLLKYFGGIDGALGASENQLALVNGIGAKTAKRIVANREAVEVDGELELAQKLGVKIITLDDEEYPQMLKQIPDPPPVLYVKGELTRADMLSLAVVGSRNCSLYGREQAARFSHLLAAAGFTIVSGLARGIDTEAHRGALAASGRTIAVLGCGLAKIYPLENEELAEQIAGNGALLSELPLNFEPLATTFPMRNRIIAGLSLGTFVIEAQSRSGALITARLALEQNREVLALPGRVDAPGSFGPHALIKDGAKCVTCLDDIMDALGTVGNLIGGHVDETAKQTEKQVEKTLFDIEQVRLNADESAVLEHLDHEPRHVDDIMTAAGIGPARCNVALTSLQLKGLVKQLPGSFYQRKN